MAFELNYWDWWVLAVMLWIVHYLFPQTFFDRAAITAIFIGFLMIFFPSLALAYQLIIFALASILSVFIGRFFGLQTQPNHRPFLNQSSAYYIGRQLVLTQAIINGQSQMNIDGIQWTLKGPDCAAGSLIKVVGVQDHYLKVELIKGKSL